MAEAACFLHAFTFPSYERNPGVEMDVLHQESVSFGRFATESLEWDKWSSFSNKRYVEEAAKHSQPGLVAKKKAFFEAYYKKKALLEQENKQDGNYVQETENVSYPGSETLVSEVPATVCEQENARSLEADSKLKTGPLEVNNCAKEKEAILKGVKNSPEVLEVTLRADGLPALKNVQQGQILEASVKTEAKGPKMLLKGPASKSRSHKTDPCQFSESSYACTESNAPIISSPFEFGTGKGTQINREKLEKILNSKESKKVKFQIKLKEKAASHLKKLKLGFCFCSKLSPERPHQSQELQKKQAKISVECIQLEKHKTSMKNGLWKHVEIHQS